MKRTSVWLSLTLVVLMIPLCATGFTGQGSLTSTVEKDGPSVIHRQVANSPSEPPVLYQRKAVDLTELDQGRAVVLLDVPTYTWSFGSASTAAAMIAAYYDRTFFPDIYTGPTNGGVMPMDNTAWPVWVDNHGDPRDQCPLSATRDGLDGRTTRGHVDDYWSFLGESGPDPFFANWFPHISGDCTADFMKTNRWKSNRGFNVDGETTFFFHANGIPTLSTTLERVNLDHLDGGYGLKLFYESLGYTVETMYNQYIAGYNENFLGFSYDEYKEEIDAGRPVLIHLDGHTMAGVGYNDNVSNLMYVHDTWDLNTYAIPWGTTYSGMEHIGVTIINLAVPTLVELTSFTASGSYNRVLLEWETATEMDNAGFHIWRSETAQGPFTRITEQLIPAQGGSTWGANYEYWDEGLSSGQFWFYKLEDIDFAGQSRFHGPVGARVH